MDLNYNVPQSYLPKNYNRVNVLNDSNGSKGICKYVNDEIYNSRVCLSAKESLEEITINGHKSFTQKIINNPQQAYYDDGKYYFDFPSIWYNANSVNKAIGLRFIEIYPKPLTLKWTCTATYQALLESHSTEISKTRDFIFVANRTMNTEEIISGMTYELNQWLISEHMEKYFKFYYTYDVDNKVCFKVLGKSSFQYGFEMDNINQNFKDFFGNPYTSKKKDSEYTTTYWYLNVWNRKDLFVHASFVNYTSFNYLGKNGEFYPKISKIYDFTFNSQKFFFEVSYDGMNPIKNQNQVDFLIGLCLIVDEKKYNGE